MVGVMIAERGLCLLVVLSTVAVGSDRKIVDKSQIGWILDSLAATLQ